MKNVAILEIFAKKKVDRLSVIDAHVRNDFQLEKCLNADLLLVESDYERALKNSYDVLILAYASFYAPFDKIKKLCENNPNAKKVVISNEYSGCSTIAPFKPPFSLIANYEKELMKKKILNNSFFLNLNLLLAKKSNKKIDKRYDCIYYSTYRPDRNTYTKEYLKKDIYISTSTKNMKKFLYEGCTAQLIKKLSWYPTKETLNLFKYSLYLEDKFTHTCFNNLANRWYEAGFCNCVMFFDQSCKNTIRKSELSEFYDEVKFYMVKSYEELQEKIKICNKDFMKHLNIQKNWRKNELILKENMLKEVYDIINKRIFE